jgi:glycosyltransferase involved in cell wall biosynthesis
MRLTMITATPRNVRAGSGTFVAWEGLTRGLAALGHDVRVVAPRIASLGAGYTLRRFVWNAMLRPEAVRDADVTVGWDMDGYRLAGRLPRFAAYIHGTIADEARFERGLVSAGMRLQARAERRSVRRAGRTITVSGYARRRIATLYGIPESGIVVVPPAFDAARWAAVLRGDGAHAAPPGSSESRRSPTVLAVARLYPRKDLTTLIRAAVPLCRSVPRVRVRIIGDGPERRDLAREVRRLGLDGVVTLDGPVSYDALVQAYHTADVFCLPSRQEAFGIVILEAMAAGLPIVACRGTAAEELIEDGANGLLVPQADAAALAAALRRLLGDADLRRRLGAPGPARARCYEPRAVARQFVEAVSHMEEVHDG